MSGLLSLIAPLIIVGVAIFALLRGTNVFAAVTEGAAEGMKTVARIFPALVCLLPAVYMLRASGALDALAHVMTPLLTALGVPPETMPLIVLRPISGGAALAAGTEIISRLGPDSLAGRTAAVMLGSTETTFYVIAVYFGAAGIKKTRYAVPAALLADLAAFLAAAWASRLFWG